MDQANYNGELANCFVWQASVACQGFVKVRFWKYLLEEDSEMPGAEVKFF